MSIYQDTRIVNLNSANSIKNNSTFNSDVYFQFTGLITEEPDNVYTEISVLNTQIPYSFYNINIYNNILKIQIGATIYTLTLTRGNYNANTLITEILNKLIVQGITDLTIVISSITGCLTFTKATGDFTLLYSGSTIFKVLGFDVATNYTSVGSILIAPFPLNLLGTLRLRIISSELQTINYDSYNKSSYNVLASIPIEAGNFGLILYDNVAQNKNILKNPVIDGFDIKIIDDDGNLINFNNQDWTITIVVTIHKNIVEKSFTQFSDVLNPILKANADGQNTTDEEQSPLQEENITEEQQIVAEPINPTFDDENNLDLLLYNLE
jgi:hypothetical protein